MPKDEEDFEAESKDYVPAVFARNAEEAEFYRELLSDHDIPALIGADPAEEETVEGEDDGPVMSHGVPVMVPEAFLDEASEIISDHDEVDEFAVDEEDVDDEEDDEEELGLEEEEEEDDEDEDGEFEEFEDDEEDELEEDEDEEEVGEEDDFVEDDEEDEEEEEEE